MLDFGPQAALPPLLETVSGATADSHAAASGQAMPVRPASAATTKGKARSAKGDPGAGGPAAAGDPESSHTQGEGWVEGKGDGAGSGGSKEPDKLGAEIEQIMERVRKGGGGQTCCLSCGMGVGEGVGVGMMEDGSAGMV